MRRLSCTIIIGGLFLFISIHAVKGEDPFFDDATPISPSAVHAAAFSSEWLRLCHYKKKISGYESQVEGSDFFLSPDGKRDPESELRFTVHAFLTDKTEGIKNARCRFPARLKFVRRMFSISIPDAHCSALDEYLSSVSNDSISVVYSSYYLNNPSSAFGHTFFKLSSSKPVMMEYGINFLANTGNDGLFFYLINGFTGRYPGKYSLVRFYDKVREYNDAENRDLWIYTLKFNADQRETFLLHLWELMPSWYGYYFLSQNCAYHTISIFEPAMPDKELTSETKSFVIPIDIIKLLYDQHLVSSYEYAPSLRNIFLAGYNALSDSQKKAFHHIVKSRDHYSNAEPAVLSSLIKYYNFAFPSSELDILNDPDARAVSAFKKLLVSLRAQMTSDDSIAEKQPVPEPPHLIHGSNRIQIGAGYNSRLESEYLRLQFRLSFHDLADSCRGFPVNSEIEMGSLSLDINKNKSRSTPECRFADATLIHVSSLNDFRFYQTAPSWSLYAGARRIVDRRSNLTDGTFAPLLSGGIGLSRLISADNRVDQFPGVLVFVMAETSLSYSSEFTREKLSPGISPLAGLKISPNADFIALFSASYTFYLHTHDSRISATLRYLFVQDTAADLAVNRTDLFYDCRLSLMKYF